MLRGDRAQLGSLLGNGRNDFRMLVADVGENQLRREIEQPIPLAVPDVGAVRGDDGHGLDLCLGRPRVEDVPAVKFVGALPLGNRGLQIASAGQDRLGSGHECEV